jgi:hypothetical protein
MNDLSVDIIMIIFDAFLQEEDGKYFAVCLGLGCSRFHRIFKRLCPPPIRLSRFQIFDDRYRYKGLLNIEIILNSFFGPQYRRKYGARHQYAPLLLNRSVYGDKEDSLKERQMNLRCYDWYLMKDRKGPNNKVDLLPYPFNMGEAWYDEVRNIYGENGGTGWSDDVKFIWKFTLPMIGLN